jgi:lipoprotein-releasing system permease protein
MNFPFFIARRYLLAKKSHNAVNVISAVSVVGVAVGAMAMIIIMSVFNGFEKLSGTLFGAFDPDIKITAVKGKNFVVEAGKMKQLEADPGVYAVSQTIEENVLVRYGDQQEIAVLKGVDEQYRQVTGLDTMLWEGEFRLWANDQPQTVVGAGLKAGLRIGLHFITPLHIYAVRNVNTLNPEEAVKTKYIFPSGVFAIDEEIDSRYLLAPLEFARNLLEKDSVTVGAIEIRVNPGVHTEEVQRRIKNIFGDEFDVKNTYQQKEFYYRILKYEKWVSFMILSFVLLILSFNVVGSLSMLMIEKKDDIFTLQGLGSDRQLIGKIFMFQGWLIVLVGAVTGLLSGVFLCWLQMTVGFVSLPSAGTYIIDAYPVALRGEDIVLVLAAVLCISFLTVYFPVKYFVKKYVGN